MCACNACTVHNASCSDAQSELMLTLGGQNVCCPQPVLNRFGQDKSIELFKDDDQEQWDKGIPFMPIYLFYFPINRFLVKNPTHYSYSKPVT